MLVFRTIIPLVSSSSLQDLIDISIKWINESPNYELKNMLNDCYGKTEFYKEKDMEKFYCFTYIKSNVTYVCVKFENRLPQEKWTTEIVFKKENTVLTSISLYYEDENFHNNLNRVIKPYIIKLLNENIGFEKDGEFSTSSYPYILKADEVDLATKIVTGDFNSILPCVYVSKSWSDEYSIDYNKLSILLCGMAHVFVEPNVYFSRNLQVRTNGANPYFGAIGIFFSGKKNRKILLLPQKNYSIRNIFDRLKNALNFGSIPDDLSYADIKSCALKDKAHVGDDSQDLKQLLNYALEENAYQEERIEALKNENQRLKERIGSLEQAIENNDSELLKRGNHPDSYPNQVLETILEVLCEVERNLSPGTRKYQILKDILEVNPSPGSKNILVDKLKKIFGDCGSSMNSQIESQLNRLGLHTTHAGKHYKVFFEDYPSLSSILPATPSDIRSWKNNFSDIKKKIL